MGFKIVINSCFGGFGLSPKAVRLLAKRGHKEAIKALEIFEEERRNWEYWQLTLDRETCRHNSLLIAVVEELGKEANGPSAELYIITISNPMYKIVEYDGRESVETIDTPIDWIDARTGE